MQVRCILIPAQARPHPVSLTAYSDAQMLEGIRHALECDYIEAIPLFSSAHAYVDEEGRLDNRPINHIATTFLHSIGRLTDDYIVGHMLVLGSAKDGGEADIPPDVEASIDFVTPWRMRWI